MNRRRLVRTPRMNQRPMHRRIARPRKLQTMPALQVTSRARSFLRLPFQHPAGAIFLPFSVVMSPGVVLGCFDSGGRESVCRRGWWIANARGIRGFPATSDSCAVLGTADALQRHALHVCLLAGAFTGHHTAASPRCAIIRSWRSLLGFSWSVAQLARILATIPIEGAQSWCGRARFVRFGSPASGLLAEIRAGCTDSGPNPIDERLLGESAIGTRLIL